MAMHSDDDYMVTEEAHIYLTEQGLQLVRRTIFPMVEIENEAFPKLTEKEYKTILHFHAQYLAALREGIQKL